jgi:hypothetical protein
VDLRLYQKGPGNPEEKLGARKGDVDSQTRRLHFTYFVDYSRSRMARDVDSKGKRCDGIFGGSDGIRYGLRLGL